MVAAIASLVGSITLLRARDIRTEHILIEREHSAGAEMTLTEDDYRKIGSSGQCVGGFMEVEYSEVSV